MVLGYYPVSIYKLEEFLYSGDLTLLSPSAQHFFYTDFGAAMQSKLAREMVKQNALTIPSFEIKGDLRIVNGILIASSFSLDDLIQIYAQSAAVCDADRAIKIAQNGKFSNIPVIQIHGGFASQSAGIH